MKLILYIATIFALCVAVIPQATNVYVTPSGTAFGNCPAGTGSAPNLTPAQFSQNTSPVAWGTGTGQIGPGTTVLLCYPGTNVGIAGAPPLLTFQGSGSSLANITLRFDTNTTLAALYWFGNPDAAIMLNGQSYLVIDGGMNGAIVNTCNGTAGSSIPGCATVYTQGTYAIQTDNASHVEIKNLTIGPLYYHCAQPCNDPVTQQQVIAIGMGNSASYIQMDNSTMHDAGWLITGGGDYITYGPNLNLYNADHDVVPQAVHWIAYGSHYHDWALWDNTSDQDHHDGIHCFGGSGGITQQATVYNNRFDGATGNYMNQFIFFEGAGSSTTCGVPGATEAVFNNTFIGNSTFPAFSGIIGNSTTGDVNDIYVNNTGIGLTNNDGTACMEVQDATSVTLENNACGGTGTLIVTGDGAVLPTFTALDYNAYENCSGFGCFVGTIPLSTMGATSATVVGNYAPLAGENINTQNTSVSACDVTAFPHLTVVTSATPNFTYSSIAGCSGATGGYLSNVDNTDFSAWQGMGWDAHGIANVGSSSYFGLNAACVPGSVGASCVPNAGSPLINAGKNLTSLCSGQPNPGLGALCYDAAGNSRPTTGTWTIGAFNAAGPNSPSLFPTIFAKVIK